MKYTNQMIMPIPIFTGAIAGGRFTEGMSYFATCYLLGMIITIFKLIPGLPLIISTFLGFLGLYSAYRIGLTMLGIINNKTCMITITRISAIAAGIFTIIAPIGFAMSIPPPTYSFDNSGTILFSAIFGLIVTAAFGFIIDFDK